MTNTDAMTMLPPLPDDFAEPSGLSNEYPDNRRPVNGTPHFDVVRVTKQDGTQLAIEYVSITTPGDPKSTPRHKVTPAIRQMYAREYRAWRNGLTTAPDGTPLEMWARLATSPHIIGDLKHINIFTIEQVANVADALLPRIPMGQTLKNDAIAWIADRKDTAALETSRRETQALRETAALQQQQLADLQQQMAALQAKPAELEPKRGPGRPPKSTLVEPA